MKKPNGSRRVIAFAFSLVFAASNLYGSAGEILTASRQLKVSAAEAVSGTEVKETEVNETETPAEQSSETIISQDTVSPESQTEEVAPAADLTEVPTASDVPVQEETVSETAESMEAEEQKVQKEKESEIKPEETEQEKKKAVRTVMLYGCGSNLESEGGMCTFNLHQIMDADFGNDDEVRFIVMTGGAKCWQTESEFLYDPATGTSPECVSGEYNQIWEVKGVNDDEYPGKMLLLDADGISGDAENAKKAEDELMSDPETLKSFINYTVENFPAEKYDLILWNHGGGPVSGYGMDEHAGESMSFAQLVDAFSDNAVTKDGGKFDFINFDACLMGNIDLTLAFADYTDYYIASPETEPGYGQYYTGWLNMLGENPNTDTYELGKKIVDDIVHFYEDAESIGYGEPATLSVIDTKKLLDSGVVSAMTEFSSLLHNEILKPDATGEYNFYDEFYTFDASIQYGSYGGADASYDLGNMLTLLNGNIVTLFDGETDTVYSDVSKRILNILDDPEIIYARGTEDIATKYPALYKAEDDSIVYDYLGTSGLYLYAVNPAVIYYSLNYLDEMDQVLGSMSDCEIKSFLQSYCETVRDYLLVISSGTAVNTLRYEGFKKDEITFDTIMTYLSQNADDPEMVNPLCEIFRILLERTPGGESAVREWLAPVILQQREEIISKDNISVKIVKGKNGTRFVVDVVDTPKRIIDGISLTYSAELPVAEAFWENYEYNYIRDYLGDDIILGKRDAEMVLDIDTDAEDPHEELIRWFNDPFSRFEIDSIEDKWYAISDADGVLHAASVSDYGSCIVAKTYFTDEDGTQKYVWLGFEDNKLADIGVFTEEDRTMRIINVSELTEEFDLMSANIIDLQQLMINVPISKSTFKLNAQNAENISLVYTDVSEIPDIEDIDGDGKSITEKLIMVDMYENSFDLSEKVYNPSETLISIGDAEVKTAYYDGTAKRPVIMMGDEVLKEGVDYSLFGSDDGNFTEAGKYTVYLIGKGKYGGYVETEFEIINVPDFATSGEFAEMSKVDYEKKHGIAVTAETEKNEDNTVTVVLKNADDQVVDTYTLDAKTGIGKNEQGETVDLPQTGVNSWNVLMMVGSAFSMVMAGVWMMFRSFRRNKKRSA